MACAFRTKKKKKEKRKKNTGLRWQVIKMSSVDSRRLIWRAPETGPKFCVFHYVGFSGTFKVGLKTRDVAEDPPGSFGASFKLSSGK